MMSCGKIILSDALTTKGAEMTARGVCMSSYKLDEKGGGVDLSEFIKGEHRYLFFWLSVNEEHSAPFSLYLYRGSRMVFEVRVGILPGVPTPVTIDAEWFDGHVLFPKGNAGELKVVCHGGRVDRRTVERAEFMSLPSYHELSVTMSDPVMTDECPCVSVFGDSTGKFSELYEPLSEFEYSGGTLVDIFGQNKRKTWQGKIKSEAELKARMNEMYREASGGYPSDDFSVYGGYKGKKLGDGTGFFTKYKAGGRWYLADPEGYAFFSMGPDCVGVSVDCRVSGVEGWLDALPDGDDPEYEKMTRRGRDGEKIAFSYQQANLYRAFGKGWYDKWREMVVSQLKGAGMNTLGNWSDGRLFGATKMPYVTSLPCFPYTKVNIFRDFPDVLSPEYEASAKSSAKELERHRDDKYMIGYFLRNEPNWAFVNNLVIADEVLINPADTYCKRELIAYLTEKYKAPSALCEAWGHNAKISDFGELSGGVKYKASELSAAANKDMRKFSRRMLRAYVEIPCRECRLADPNHMILGMRWAWISDPDLATGWECFDVFSINCYAVDPTPSIQNVVNLGVDLPVMIGEFHFGALDAGLTSTGLEGVRTQRDRGIAYRYYIERAAAHPNGVGCHYFQCYDQFVLGRFDGENYNIGLFDVCCQPYPLMFEEIRAASEDIYPVMSGERAPVAEKAESIPMIAF